MFKLGRLIRYAALFAIFISACFTANVFAEVRIPRTEEFAENNILFYNPTNCIPQSAPTLPGSNSGGTISGSSNEEKVWSYFASAGYDPMVIAAIVGNIRAESGFNPYVESSAGYFGLYQAGGGRKTALLSAMKNAGLHPDDVGSSPSQDIIDRAIQFQLDFMTSGGDPGNRFAGFMNNLGVVSSPSPGSYAELFLVAFEGAISNPEEGTLLSDPGVRAWALATYGSEYWQHPDRRQEYALAAYNAFSGSTFTPSENTATNTSNTPTSSRICPENEDNSFEDRDWGEGGERIANASIELTWPYQADDTCLDESGNLVQNWTSNYNQCAMGIKPEYSNARSQVGTTAGTWTDCGVYVATAVRYSGVDPNYGSNILEIYNVMVSSDLWEDVTDLVAGNSANLMPGDVFHTGGTGHTFIYVGGIPKNYGNDVAAASQGGHTPWLKDSVVWSDSRSDRPDGRYHIFRVKGGGGSSITL